MDAIEAIRGRRSVRDYQPRPVDPELVEMLVRDACHAPWTPLARPEPWLFNIIAGRERIAAYGERAKTYALAHRPKPEGYGWAEDPAFSIFHGAPLVVIVSGRADYPLALEECTRAAQVLTIAAHARGLGSCWVGSPNLWLRDPATRDELGVPDGFMPHAALTLGYPAAIPPPPPPFEPRIVWLGREATAVPASPSDRPLHC